MTIYTVGHSTRPIEQFLALLEREGVRHLADVRTFPGSRKFPHFGRDALAAALAARGIGYSHQPALGGRRRPRSDSPNGGWRNAGFRGYADHMATPEFRDALDALVRTAAGTPTVVMCSEAVPWRCHRSLVADALIIRGNVVEHIMSSGSRRVHELTSWAHVEGTVITYPPSEALTNP